MPEMRRVAFGTTFLLLIAAVPAAADSFYVCKKKGQPNHLTNEGGISAATRNGYRCRKRMDFGGEAPPAAKAPTRRSSSPQKARTPTPTTRRFLGPAGERETYEPWIQEASRRYNVPANLIRAVIRVESNFRPQAVSSAGARGLMQLMPGTAAEMGVSDRSDPRQSILGGTRYLRVLINAFQGDPKLAIAAYHAGPGIVKRRGGIPFEATRRYVRKVITNYLKYRDSRL